MEVGQRFDALKLFYEEHPPTEPMKFEIPDNTLESTGISYIPYHWPAPSTYAHQNSFWVWVHDCDRYKKNFSKLSATFFDVLDLLLPYGGWVEASCNAALIPDSVTGNFSVQINGVTLSKKIHRPTALRRRLQIQRQPLQITTCNARIEGKGLASLNKSSGYYISLDMKPFSISPSEWIYELDRK